MKTTTPKNSGTKQYSEALDDPSLQQVLRAAKHLALTVDKGLPRLTIAQARAIGTLQQLMLCPTCNGGTDLDNPNCIRICEGEAAHGPKADYKQGDRVRILSLPGISNAELGGIVNEEYVVTVVTTDVEDREAGFAHDLLVENKDRDQHFWCDFGDVEKLSRFGWIDGYIRKGEHVVEISGVPLSPKPSLTVLNHSPDGFCWGYSGSGPTQLALAILLQYGSKQFAVKHYMTFREDVLRSVARNADRGFAMHGQAVVAWIVAHSSDDHVKKDCQPSDKIWLMTTPDECECDKADANFAVPGECECNRQDVHMHCYCGGVLDVM